MGSATLNWLGGSGKLQNRLSLHAVDLGRCLACRALAPPNDSRHDPAVAKYARAPCRQ